LPSVVYFLASVIVFFFSSSRRHTRFKCDWSSDVCSSDLARLHRGREAPVAASCGRIAPCGYRRGESPVSDAQAVTLDVRRRKFRSEERRVGKWGRYGWCRGYLCK